MFHQTTINNKKILLMFQIDMKVAFTVKDTNYL